MPTPPSPRPALAPPARTGLAALLLACAALAGCGTDTAEPLDQTALRAEWGQWVASRDSLFRSASSPLLPADRPSFDGLPYFAYDSTLAVPAALVPTLSQDTVRFPTTSGELRPMITAGHLVFTAGGVQRRLEAFQTLDDGPLRLFVPFRDATSGRDTYGGGRYLDVDLEPSGRYALDLNRAYHPYCVYDVSFSCPLPPAENRLELPVTAGERLPTAP
ncbi:DUF1684 domain-containing protein [Rubrivirga sp. S365]|uniref:DUF1684 domain-containing protein n=1 Tax=Rubrivirga sp. S365 TaxID=3076080 RepID=UPI0028C6D77B|nr:DUF1684 domain-containing protein [Rubrivirga sp. S365]MDT7855021.1 DUF1684 domain-containing protein [Rubrivirga sp. S365]